MSRQPDDPPANDATAIDGGFDEDSVTQLLVSADTGDNAAWDRIYALLYRDLHRIARSQIRQQAALDLSPTSLISETWLKLAGARLDIENRRHLTALIARAMRFVLLDETRRLLADKRSGARSTVELDTALATPVSDARLEQLLALNQALEDLARLDQRLADVVELRYFGGLTEVEVAVALGLTERTIRRDWRRARAYLVKQLGEDDQVIEI